MKRAFKKGDRVRLTGTVAHVGRSGIVVAKSPRMIEVEFDDGLGGPRSYYAWPEGLTLIQAAAAPCSQLDAVLLALFGKDNPQRCENAAALRRVVREQREYSRAVRS